MKEYSLLEIKTYDNGVALITMNRPPLNLLSPELLTQIRDCLNELAADNAMRAVVLTGSKRSFCAGADVTTFGILPPGLNTPFGQQIMMSIEKCRLPIIAAIDGWALGGGLELALSCDVRYASEDARIALTEANLGLIAAYGGNTRLPWLIGEANAKRMFFTAKKLTGKEAYEYGVVQEVYPSDELIDKALELAGEMAKKAPLSIAAAKKVMYKFRENLFAASYLREQEEGRKAATSQDHKEGWKAFKEKRDPVFQNK